MNAVKPGMGRSKLLLVVGCVLAVFSAGLSASTGAPGLEAGSPLLVVAGASGKTGRLVLEPATKAGYRVRALARDPAGAREEIGADYEWTAADVRDPASLQTAMRDVTYVVCAIGATERSGPNSAEFVDFGGVKNLVDAAKAAGVRHFVLVSSVGAGGGGGVFGWLLNTLLMPGVLDWKGKGEEYLRASGIPYTILRPGGLTNAPGGEVGIRLTRGGELGGGTIARADVAAVAVYALGRRDAAGKTLEMANDEATPPGAWRSVIAALEEDVSKQATSQ